MIVVKANHARNRIHPPISVTIVHIIPVREVHALGLSLNEDGTTTITWQTPTETGLTEHRIELPMPTLGQLGDIMDYSDSALEENDQLKLERARILTEMREAAGSDDATADFETLARLRKESSDLEAKARQLGSTRFVYAVRQLAPGPEAEAFAADPPAWAHSIVGFARLLNHFSSVPFDGPTPSPNGGGSRQPADTSN